MKKLIVLMVAITIIAMAGIAMADTANVVVSASVNGTCKFTTVPTLDFGVLDQTLATDAVIAGDLIFWCTKSSLYTLSDPNDSDGTHSDTLVSGGGDLIPFTLTYNNYSGSGNGKTSPITSRLNATITNANYIDAPSGTYTKTVVFSITP